MKSENCISRLLGVKGFCENDKDVLFWLNDIPGIKADTLSQLAYGEAPTGKMFGQDLIDRASRMLTSDIEGIYGSGYKINVDVGSSCSTCDFTTSTFSGSKSGIMIENNSGSDYSKLVVDSLKVKIYSTGTFTIVLDDGETTKEIAMSFVSGQEVILKNVNFETTSKKINVYFKETGVSLSILKCSSSGGCGCSGSLSKKDVIFRGINNLNLSSDLFGFVPCVNISCDSNLLICGLTNAIPRLISITALYKAAELYFSENVLSVRNNRVAGIQIEEKISESEYYGKQYFNKLQGKNTMGIKDSVFQLLKNKSDRCISCDNIVRTGWATT